MNVVFVLAFLPLFFLDASNSSDALRDRNNPCPLVTQGAFAESYGPFAVRWDSF